MQIESYSDYGDIPSEISEQLLLHQSLCWGSEPFGEFAICNGCNKLFSIENLGLNKEDIRVGFSLDQNCGECDEVLRLMYLNDEFQQEIIDYFRFQVSLIVAFDQGKLFGFGMTVKKSVQGLLEYEFSTRPNSFDISELATSIGINIQDEVICLQHIYTTLEVRKTGLGIMILRKMLHELDMYGDTMVLLETHLKSGGYPLARSLGFSNIHGPDTYGYILQSASSINHIQQKLGSNDGNTSFSQAMFSSFRDEANTLVQKNLAILEPKYY